MKWVSVEAYNLTKRLGGDNFSEFSLAVAKESQGFLGTPRASRDCSVRLKNTKPKIFWRESFLEGRSDTNT